MTSSITMGYCKYCKQDVELIRQDFDICLAIILLLFTAGIGLIIYLIIYFSKPKNQCILCGTEIISPIAKESVTPKQIHYSPQREDKSLTVEIIEGEEANYCPLCGTQLDERNKTYCPSCGSEI